MLSYVDAENASSHRQHTVYGKRYNFPAPTRDRIMPSYYGPKYTRAEHTKTFGVNSYNTPPILAPTIEYMGRFAIADLAPVERPLPWRRITK